MLHNIELLPEGDNSMFSINNSFLKEETNLNGSNESKFEIL
jgi:hypothetical protein